MLYFFSSIIGIILSIVFVSIVKNGDICKGIANVGIIHAVTRQTFFQEDIEYKKVVTKLKDFVQGIDTMYGNSSFDILVYNDKNLRRTLFSSIGIVNYRYNVSYDFRPHENGTLCTITVRPADGNGGITDNLTIDNCNNLMNKALLCLNTVLQEVYQKNNESSIQDIQDS